MPRSAEVMTLLPCFLMPRIIMHRCSAWMTTATPASNGTGILKGRNAVIFAPHPAAKQSCRVVCGFMREGLPGVEVHQTDAAASRVVVVQEARSIDDEVDGLQAEPAEPLCAELAACVESVRTRRPPPWRHPGPF